MLKSGDIFYVDSLSHDAVKFSPRSNMKEVMRKKGNPIPDSLLESAPSFNKNRRSCSTDSRDSEYQLYFNGMNNLSMINTESFEANEIENFFTWNNQWCFAMLAIADRNFTKFFGVGYQSEQKPTFHFYGYSSGTSKHEFASLLAE